MIMSIKTTEGWNRTAIESTSSAAYKDMNKNKNKARDRKTAETTTNAGVQS